MRGNNTLNLNEATIIEALQEYFDKRSLRSPFKVTSVTYTGGTFRVSTEEREIEEVKVEERPPGC